VTCGRSDRAGGRACAGAEIDDEEGRRLVRIVRRASGSVVTWRRAQMVLLPAQGMAAGIAKVAFTSEDRVRDVIRNFNADGFGSRYPRYRGRRAPKFTSRTRGGVGGQRQAQRTGPQAGAAPPCGLARWSFGPPGVRAVGIGARGSALVKRAVAGPVPGVQGGSPGS
jgi:hypothetical protein